MKAHEQQQQQDDMKTTAAAATTLFTMKCNKWTAGNNAKQFTIVVTNCRLNACMYERER